MSSGYVSMKEKKLLKGFTRITMLMEAKIHSHKEEVLEEMTLCSPLNKSLNKSGSLKLSINNITRPKDILGDSIVGGLAAVLENDGMSVDFDQFAEPSYIKDEEREESDRYNDSPNYASKNQKRDSMNQQSMYFTYGDQLEKHFTRRWVTW